MSPHRHMSAESKALAIINEYLRLQQPIPVLAGFLQGMLIEPEELGVVLEQIQIQMQATGYQAQDIQVLVDD